MIVVVGVVAVTLIITAKKAVMEVANPMPKTSPGAWWDMRVISEDFGLIDMFHITIPKDLTEQEPLGDSVDVYKMKERPPCLLDLGYEMDCTPMIGQIGLGESGGVTHCFPE